MSSKSGLRIGEVSSIDPARATARVVFDDMEDQVTAEIPIAFKSASPSDKSYEMPDIGVQVVCSFIEEGEGEGSILGFIYSDALPPPFSNPDIVGRRFGNGDYIYYNKSTGKAFVKASGGIDVIGDVKITGNLSIVGESKMEGGLNTTGPVISQGIVLPDHVHRGVQSGGSNTGEPVGGDSG